MEIKKLIRMHASASNDDLVFITVGLPRFCPKWWTRLKQSFVGFGDLLSKKPSTMGKQQVITNLGDSGVVMAW